MSSKLLNLESLTGDKPDANDPCTVTFELQLKKLHKRIADLNKHHPPIKECIYTPPSFIFGRPLYDINEMLQYLYDSLNSNGIKVEPHDSDSLYISWKKEDLNMAAYNFQVNSKQRDVKDSLAIVERPITNITKKGSSTSVTTNFQTFVKVNHKGSDIKDYLPVNIR